MVCAASKASQPPMISRPSMSCCLQAAADRVQVLDGRHVAADAEFRAAAAAPAFDVTPVQLPDVAVDQGPRKLPCTPSMVCPRCSPSRTAARAAAFIPGASPPTLTTRDPAGLGPCAGRSGSACEIEWKTCDHLGVAVAAHGQRGVVVLGGDRLRQLAGLAPRSPSAAPWTPGCAWMPISCGTLSGVAASTSSTAA